jgi:hypothetical protein
MSVRILFNSHDRCWTVGSLPCLLCHLATCQCASASVSGSLASSESPDHSWWMLTTVESNYPSVEVVWIDGACESTLQGAYHAVRCVEKIPIFQAEPGQMLLIQLLPTGTLVHAARRLVATTRPCLEGHWLVNLTSTIFSLPSPDQRIPDPERPLSTRRTNWSCIKTRPRRHPRLREIDI